MSKRFGLGPFSPYFDREVDEDAFIETGNEMPDGVAAFWNGLDEQHRRIAAI